MFGGVEEVVFLNIGEEVLARSCLIPGTMLPQSKEASGWMAPEPHGISIQPEERPCCLGRPLPAPNSTILVPLFLMKRKSFPLSVCSSPAIAVHSHQKQKAMVSQMPQ